VSPSSRVTITVEADGWFGLAERLVAALERLVDPADQPGIAPAGPLILVPKGAKLDRSMSGIPIGKDAIQAVVPGNYDGPVGWDVESGPAIADPENDDGSEGRIVLTDEAAVGDQIVVIATADVRHGPDVVESVLTWTHTVLDRDATPLQEKEFRVVDKGAE
jgi:hypothetical protein